MLGLPLPSFVHRKSCSPLTLPVPNSQQSSEWSEQTGACDVFYMHLSTLQNSRGQVLYLKSNIFYFSVATVFYIWKSKKRCCRNFISWEIQICTNTDVIVKWQVLFKSAVPSWQPMSMCPIRDSPLWTIMVSHYVQVASTLVGITWLTVHGWWSADHSASLYLKVKRGLSSWDNPFECTVLTIYKSLGFYISFAPQHKSHLKRCKSSLQLHYISFLAQLPTMKPFCTLIHKVLWKMLGFGRITVNNYDV